MPSALIIGPPGCGAEEIVAALAAGEDVPVADAVAIDRVQAALLGLGASADAWATPPGDPTSSGPLREVSIARAPEFAGLAGGHLFCRTLPAWEAARGGPDHHIPLALVLRPAPVAVATLASDEDLPLAAAAALWESYARSLAVHLGAGERTVTIVPIPADLGALAKFVADHLGLDDDLNLTIADPGTADQSPPEDEVLSPAQIELDRLLHEGRFSEISPTPSAGAADALRRLAAERRSRASANADTGAALGRAYRLERTLFRAAAGQQSSARKLAGWLEETREASARLLRSSRWKLGNFLSLRFKDPAAYPPLDKVYDKFSAWEQGQDELPDEADLWRSAQVRADVPIQPEAPAAEVVICIHNALPDVRRCLASVARNGSELLRRIILVDDGSEPEVGAALRDFAESVPIPVEIIENPEALGYTKAANQGLRRSIGDYTILLNSDTIVTPGWIDRLVTCGQSDPKIGLIGALSNAASWQSVPKRHDGNGDWMINELPPGIDPDTLAWLLALHHGPSYPRVPLVNGFCFAIRREVIKAIGYFDEEAFPKGYGEENDYGFRAGHAGFELAVADDVYVYHAKSRSFTHDRRKVLSKASGEILKERYRKELGQSQETLRDSPGLAAARGAVADLQARRPPCRVLYLMTFRGTGGGTHSIAQEAAGLLELGVLVGLAVRDRDLEFYQSRYPALPAGAFLPYADEAALSRLAGRFDVVVATLFTSVRILREIANANPGVLPAYYIQDYEPLFFQPDDPYYPEAVRSYDLVPDAVRFAKTEWLCQKVRDEHAVEMHRVLPSIDTGVYHPPGGKGDAADPRDAPDAEGRPPLVCAMVRPDSPRRSPQLTFDVLRALKQELGPAVEVAAFGCGADHDFFETVAPGEGAGALGGPVHGLLRREEVAALLQKADVFLDLSEYQAFGRTALEAMACGCCAVVPDAGGASEYARDGENCLVVDTSDRPAIDRAVRGLIDDPGLRAKLRRAGKETAARYSIPAAAQSQLDLFLDVMGA